LKYSLRNLHSSIEASSKIYELVAIEEGGSLIMGMRCLVRHLTSFSQP